MTTIKTTGSLSEDGTLEIFMPPPPEMLQLDNIIMRSKIERESSRMEDLSKKIDRLTVVPEPPKPTARDIARKQLQKTLSSR